MKFNEISSEIYRPLKYICQENFLKGSSKTSSVEFTKTEIYHGCFSKKCSIFLQSRYNLQFKIYLRKSCLRMISRKSRCVFQIFDFLYFEKFVIPNNSEVVTSQWLLSRKIEHIFEYMSLLYLLIISSWNLVN